MHTEIAFDGQAVADQLRGEAAAESFLQALRTQCGDGNELLALIRQIEGNDAALAGVCRYLQKALARR